MIPIYDSPLPPGWSEYPLKEITTRKRGYSWSKEQETNTSEIDAVPVIRIPNIGEVLDRSNLLYIREVSRESLEQASVSKNWILFVGSNGNPERIGDSVLIEEDEEMVFASFLMGITSSDSSILLPEFLAFWMRQHRVHQTFSKTSQQTTGLANFSWSASKKLPVRFPSNVDEQREIIAAIRSVDEVIARTRDEISATQQLKKSLMQQLFTRGIPGRHKTFNQLKIVQRRIIDIPDAWEAIKLGSCISKIQYGTNEPSNDYGGGYPVIAIPQVVSPRLELKDTPFAELSQREADDLRLQQGDVLLIRTNGNPDYLAKSTVVSEEVAAQHVVYASYLIRVRTDSKRLLGEYLNYFLASPLGRRQALAMANTSAGNNNISTRALKQFWLPRPEIAEQEEIIEILNDLEDTIDATQGVLNQQIRLKKSLLQNLLTGKIRIDLEAAA
jgi:type I restriction enzyme S subunit